MRIPYQLRALGLAVVWLVAPVTKGADDGIRTYTVSKEHPIPATAGADANADMPTTDIPVGSTHVTWTTPTTWKELAPTKIRIGNFAVLGQDGAKAEVAIFSFPGSVGTELDNVNRWRNELHLPAVSPGKIASEPVTIDSTQGKLYEIPGASNSIVAVSLPRNEATWFFKLKGDKDVVTDAEPVFRDFLKTVHFAAASAAAVEAPAASANAEPKWNLPANWTEKEPGPMIFKSFSAQDDAGRTAVVNVSFFPGDVGGTFANVNRWRAQMNLPPVDDDKLASVTQPLEISGGHATMVDFTGTDAKTGQPARLIAIALPHGDNTWFYKLIGDGAAVENEKAAFMKFVQSVQYP